MLRHTLVLIAMSAALAACLPRTSYVPKSGKAALAMKGGKYTMIKNGVIVDQKDMGTLLDCDQGASAYGRTSVDNFKSAEKNAMTSAMFNALTPLFPLSPLLGLPWAIRSAKQDSRARAAMVDALNRHNDAGPCVITAGPGSAIGVNR